MAVVADWVAGAASVVAAVLSVDAALVGVVVGRRQANSNSHQNGKPQARWSPLLADMPYTMSRRWLGWMG